MIKLRAVISDDSIFMLEVNGFVACFNKPSYSGDGLSIVEVDYALHENEDENEDKINAIKIQIDKVDQSLGDEEKLKNIANWLSDFAVFLHNVNFVEKMCLSKKAKLISIELPSIRNELQRVINACRTKGNGWSAAPNASSDKTTLITLKGGWTISAAPYEVLDDKDWEDAAKIKPREPKPEEVEKQQDSPVVKKKDEEPKDTFGDDPNDDDESESMPSYDLIAKYLGKINWEDGLYDESERKLDFPVVLTGFTNKDFDDGPSWRLIIDEKVGFPILLNVESNEVRAVTKKDIKLGGKLFLFVMQRYVVEDKQIIARKKADAAKYPVTDSSILRLLIGKDRDKILSQLNKNSEKVKAEKGKEKARETADDVNQDSLNKIFDAMHSGSKGASEGYMTLPWREFIKERRYIQILPDGDEPSNNYIGAVLRTTSLSADTFLILSRLSFTSVVFPYPLCYHKSTKAITLAADKQVPDELKYLVKNIRSKKDEEYVSHLDQLKDKYLPDKATRDSVGDEVTELIKDWFRVNRERLAKSKS